MNVLSRADGQQYGEWAFAVVRRHGRSRCANGFTDPTRPIAPELHAELLAKVAAMQADIREKR
jgi:hypothetical protein